MWRPKVSNDCSAGLLLFTGFMLIALAVALWQGQKQIDRKMTHHREYRVIRGVVVSKWRDGK